MIIQIQCTPVGNSHPLARPLQPTPTAFHPLLLGKLLRLPQPGSITVAGQLHSLLFVAFFRNVPPSSPHPAHGSSPHPAQPTSPTVRLRHLPHRDHLLIPPRHLGRRRGLLRLHPHQPPPCPPALATHSLILPTFVKAVHAFAAPR